MGITNGSTKVSIVNILGKLTIYKSRKNGKIENITFVTVNSTLKNNL